MKRVRTKPATIEQYLAGFSDEVRDVLERVRATIRRALPAAEEVISYGIPAFRVNGHTVLYFAGWKDHFSVYPANNRMEAAFEKELRPYELSGRGTIRFPLSRPPLKLIGAISRFRLREVTASKTPQKGKTEDKKATLRRKTRARAGA